MQFNHWLSILQQIALLNNSKEATLVTEYLSLY